MHDSMYPKAKAYRVPGIGIHPNGGKVPIETEHPYRQVVQSLPVALYSCEVQGYITLFNQAAVELWGREPVIGHDLWCGSWRIYRLDGTLLPLEQCPMGIALREGRIVQGEEIIIERPDGTRRYVMPFPQPIRDAQGIIVGAMSMLLDITERRMAESELAVAKDDLSRQVAALKEAKESAEAANRSKDKFLAVLSHELRTPLTPVLMAASAMEKNANLPIEVRNDAAMICDSVRLETKLIDDLLDLSRITNGKLRLQPESVDLNDTVLDVCEICRAQFKAKDIHLHCELDESVGRVTADPARLQQVLWNIFNNAAKFTPDGGNVYVKTCLNDRGRLRVQVRDTGVGIAPDQLTRIFNAFEQGSPASRGDSTGLGLGLAISKALVELHQGSIFAESEGPSTGSSFTIELPMEIRCPPDPPSKGQLDATEQVRSFRVLVVEDHADTARTLTRFLTMSGYTVKMAGTAAEALELASLESFDIILSDIGLPDMTGYELMKQIRSRSPMKGIAISGYGMDEDVRRSQDAGFSEHLVKPLDIIHLERAIARAMANDVAREA
jgi:PAS domain S-box-containing protein